MYLLITAVYLIILKIKNRKNTNKTFKLLSMKRYFRYIKLILNRKVVLCFSIFSIISNSIVIYQNQKYDNKYTNEEKIIGEAIVLSNKQEKEYNNVYKIKYEDTYLYLKIDKKLIKDLKYGDKIRFSGEFIEATKQRNYGGFNYKQYLKTLKIYGSIKVEEIEIIASNQTNLFFRITNEIAFNIKQKIDSFMKKEDAAILKGLLLGDTREIADEVQENFRISSISHILAVSGMHVTYVIMGIKMLFESHLGKRKTKFIIIIFLILYTFITGFSPSIVRASVMGILLVGAEILHRKNDIWNSIAISLLLILFYNPFLIMNVGLQFSYLGTIGIIMFHKNILKLLKDIKTKNKKWKYQYNKKIMKFINKVKEVLAVTISAQLTILPVMIYHFNLLGIYFFITNLLVSIIIGPIIMLGAIAIFFSIFLFPITQILGVILEILIKSLIVISNFSKIPFSKIYVATPKIYDIILYFILIFLFNLLYTLYHSKELNRTQMRARNLIALIRYKVFMNRGKYKKIIFILVFIIIFISITPKKLNIHFVDVGQGDCTFIVTPRKQTILIDGGGSASKEYDVGKNTLLPYVLDRGYTKLDYIFISHFDQDHVAGILTILEELKVETVIIPKQEENTENYQKFLELIKEKRIKVNIVKKGDKVNIEKNVYFDILWPEKEQIKENVINNNAIVMKMHYGNFSILFTGDIEEKAEEKILKVYEGKERLLNANILKVAHHGSKTSTTEKFLKWVNPKAALIGVGKNNLFKHPSEKTIENLRKYNVTIYRTDENGEITITIDKNGEFLINCINLTKL